MTFFFENLVALKRARLGGRNIDYSSVFIDGFRGDQKMTDIWRKGFSRLLLLLLFFRELQRDDQIAFVRLPMELVLDRMKSRVLSSMMLAITLEEFVR